MEGEAPCESGTFSMIKQLASCNQGRRGNALRLFKAWFPLQDQIPEDDLKKIWKGLFYCVWHADKALYQMDLNDRLSSLLVCLPRPLAAQYFSIFLLTMHREWCGIDALRLDKFFYLIRRFLLYFFVFLKNSSWDLEVLREFVGVLEARTFLAEGKFPSNGVSYHVASVFLEELKAFLPLGSDVLNVMLSPFINALGRSLDKVLVGKIKSNVFDVLVRSGRDFLAVKKSGGEIDGKSEVALLGAVALILKLSTRFYDLGSEPNCVQGSRKILFSLHSDFSKLEKDLEESGIVSLSAECNDDGDQKAPPLVPFNVGINGGASERASADAVSFHETNTGDKASKKNRKKEKRAKKKKKKNEYSEKELQTTDKSSDLDQAGEDMISSETGSVANGKSSGEGLGGDYSLIEFNETVISNLQMKFEKVAADAGLDNGDANLCSSSILTANGHVSKKRKRAKSLGHQNSQDIDPSVDELVEGVKGALNSTKKVRFAKSNLVWKPHTPLPPHSLRLPPSVTPRGSALKKGVLPGPIREVPPSKKRSKTKMKKGQKALKSISPAVKRMKKLKSRSA